MAILKSTLMIFLASVVFLTVAVYDISIGLWIDLTMRPALLPLYRVPKHGRDLTQINKVSSIEVSTMMINTCGACFILVAITACFTGSCIRSNKDCFWALKITYFAFIIIMDGILLMQGLSAALVHIYKFRFQKESELYFKRTIENEYFGPFDKANRITNAWNAMQVAFGCCGVYGQKDYETLGYWNRTWINGTNAQIPLWCCKFKPNEIYFFDEIMKPEDIQNVLEDPNCPVTKNKSYDTGCHHEMLLMVNRYHEVIGLSGIAISLFGLFTVFAISCCYGLVEQDPENVFTIKYYNTEISKKEISYVSKKSYSQISY